VTPFYSRLPTFTDFNAVTRLESFTPLPADWHVATCDVRDSTAAVLAGNYKHVNTVAAAAVTAVLNVAGSTEIPSVFEGDGSAFCVPPEFLGDVRAALAKTRDMASRSFGLDLRIATLPVAKVREAGFDILVARYQVSANYVQSVFAGGGLAWADRAMKDPATAALYAVDPGIAPRGSHEGLECRWQDIPSRHGETVSLMVRATTRDARAAAALYGEIIAKVRETYGTEEACHPVSLSGLIATFDSRRLDNEVGVIAADRSPLGKWLYLMRTRWIVALGWVLMKFGLHTEETDWSRYKETLVSNSDVRKFNDIYRQILAGTAEQRTKLAAWLEERERSPRTTMGPRHRPRPIMTCLVFNYSGKHLHFIG
jgi:hypothetical protein